MLIGPVASRMLQTVIVPTEPRASAPAEAASAAASTATATTIPRRPPAKVLAFVLIRVLLVLRQLRSWTVVATRCHLPPRPAVLVVPPFGAARRAGPSPSR